MNTQPHENISVKGYASLFSIFFFVAKSILLGFKQLTGIVLPVPEGILACIITGTIISYQFINKHKRPPSPAETRKLTQASMISVIVAELAFIAVLAFYASVTGGMEEFTAKILDVPYKVWLTIIPMSLVFYYITIYLIFARFSRFMHGQIEKALLKQK